LELSTPAPVEGQAVQPEHDHAADSKDDVSDAAETSLDSAT